MSDHLLTRLSVLLDGRTSRSQEHEIIHVIKNAEPASFTAAFDELDIRRLMHSVDNHFFGPKHRDALLDVLTGRRVRHLSLHAQAKLAVVLQEGRTDARQERALRDVLLSRRSEELSHLKNIINLTKGRHDLEGLVFSDIGNTDVRAEILEHFRAESPLAGPQETKILSDIDDTALARIHEERYPKGTVIPGVLAFYEALDIGPVDDPRSRGDLTFVTARPSDALGLMKGQSRRTLTEAGITNLSIMTGSWFNMATRDSMAAKKVENIAHYAQLFPEYDLVFVGDSGQGDIDVALQILEAHPDSVRGCFIHDVVAMPPERRRALAAKGIWVVDTYVGAAVKARDLGLLSEAGLRSVMDETRTGLGDIEWDSPEQEQRIRELVERDAATA